MNIRRSARITSLALFVGLLSAFATIGTGAARDLEIPAENSNHAAATTLFETVFNGNSFDAPAGLISANAVIHTPYGEFIGPEGLQDYLAIVRRAYPDASYAVSSIDVQGDTVTVRWNMTATQYLIDPTEPVLDVLVRRSGETTITFADGEIAALNQTHQQTAITEPIDVAFVYGPSE